MQTTINLVEPYELWANERAIFSGLSGRIAYDISNILKTVDSQFQWKRSLPINTDIFETQDMQTALQRARDILLIFYTLKTPTEDTVLDFEEIHEEIWKYIQAMENNEQYPQPMQCDDDVKFVFWLIDCLDWIINFYENMLAKSEEIKQNINFVKEMYAKEVRELFDKDWLRFKKRENQVRILDFVSEQIQQGKTPQEIKIMLQNMVQRMLFHYLLS